MKPLFLLKPHVPPSVLVTPSLSSIILCIPTFILTGVLSRVDALIPSLDNILFGALTRQIPHANITNEGRDRESLCWESKPKCPIDWLDFNNVCYLSPVKMATVESSLPTSRHPFLSWDDALQYCSNLTTRTNGTVQHLVRLLSMRSKVQRDFVLNHVMPIINQIAHLAPPNSDGKGFSFWIADSSTVASLDYIRELGGHRIQKRLWDEGNPNSTLGPPTIPSTTAVPLCPVIVMMRNGGARIEESPCHASKRFVCERSRGANYRCSSKGGQCATHVTKESSSDKQFSCVCLEGFQGDGVRCVEEESVFQFKSSQVVLFFVLVFAVSVVVGCLCWLFSLNMRGWCPIKDPKIQDPLVKTPHVGTSRWSQLERPSYLAQQSQPQQRQNILVTGHTGNSGSTKDRHKRMDDSPDGSDQGGGVPTKPNTMFDIQKPKPFESYGLPGKR